MMKVLDHFGVESGFAKMAGMSSLLSLNVEEDIPRFESFFDS
jgi:hypothetical protein